MSGYSQVERNSNDGSVDVDEAKSRVWFKWMDSILMTNGLNVFKVHGKSVVLKWVLRSSSVLYSHSLLLHSILTYGDRMDDPYSLLFLMQLGFGVVSFQSILRSRDTLLSIITDIYRCSNSRLKANLERASKTLFFIWIVVLLFQFALLICQWYFIGTKQWMLQVFHTFEGPVSGVHHVLVACDIMCWVMFVIGLIVGLICVFVFVLYCLNTLYMTRMAQLSEKLDYSQTLAKNLEFFREIRSKYQGLKEASNDIFGITVCGYFAECYLETGLRLANDDNKAEKSLYSLVTDWGLYGLQVVLLLTFILFLSKLSDKEENSEKRLLCKVISNKTRNYDIDYQKMMLIIEITQSPIVPVTGWNVFVINRSLLLGFLGSVIPFAVLIASLFEKNKLITSTHCSNYTQLFEYLLKSRNGTFVA